VATSEELQRVVGKLMLDPQFRRDFAGDPAAAAATIGVQLTPEEVSSFQQNMAAFIAAAAELEKGAAAAVSEAEAAGGHVAAIFRE
jgi:hypothetical protein